MHCCTSKKPHLSLRQGIDPSIVIFHRGASAGGLRIRSRYVFKMCPSSDFAEMKTSVMIGDSPSLHTLQSRMPQYINHSSTPTMKQESQPLHLSTLLQSSLSLTPVRTLTMHCTKIFLLSGLLSIVQANDIIFYPNPACSQGNFNGCFGIGANTCCFGSGTDTFAISISKGSNDFATMFNGGGCTNPVCVCSTSSRALSLHID